MAEPKTKICEACDQEIGASEETCPKCGVTFADLDAEVNVVTRAQAVAEKRLKKKEPEPELPSTPNKPKSIFRSLARLADPKGGE